MSNQKGIISLEEFFKEKYHYQYTSRENLASAPFIEYENFGATAVCWIKDGEDKYLFKDVNDQNYTWLGELLSYEIAKVLDIPCAEYKLATLEGNLCILSKNFVKEDETLLLGAQIVQEVLNKYPYLKEKSIFDDQTFLEIYNVPREILTLNFENRLKYLHNNLNNLEELWSILSIYYDIHDIPKDSLKDIMDRMMKMFFFDLLTFQADRHITNWGILAEGKDKLLGLKPSNLFDQAASFGFASEDLDRRIDNFYRNLESYQRVGHEKSKNQFISSLYKDRMLFTPSEDAIINAKSRRRKNNLEILDYFLFISSTDDINILLNYIEKLEQVGIQNILDSILKKYDVKIDPKIYQFVCDSSAWNLYFLKENIYQKRR